MYRNIPLHCTSIAIGVHIESKCCLLICFFFMFSLDRLDDFHIFFSSFGWIYGTRKLNRTFHKKMAWVLQIDADEQIQRKWFHFLPFNKVFFSVWYVSKYGTHQTKPLNAIIFLHFIKIRIIFNLNQPTIIQYQRVIWWHARDINIWFNCQFEVGIRKIQQRQHLKKTLQKSTFLEHPFKLYKQYKKSTGMKIDRLNDKNDYAQIKSQLTQWVVQCNERAFG